MKNEVDAKSVAPYHRESMKYPGYLAFLPLIVVSGAMASPISRTYSLPVPVLDVRPFLSETLGEVHSSCRSDMVEVRGNYCKVVKETCLRHRPPVKPHPYVCEEWAPSECQSNSRTPMDFCIDTYEWPNIKGELPQVEMTWYDADQACKHVGKRLCSPDEVVFACEGEDMKPYPYGDGLVRDSTACNIDRDPIDPFLWGWNKDHTERIQVGLRPLDVVDQRVPSGSFPRCVSPFGVYDIVGNADEWSYDVTGNKDKAPYFSDLHSGHWVWGARNQCRGFTPDHGPTFSMYVTGARCCADVAP